MNQVAPTREFVASSPAEVAISEASGALLAASNALDALFARLGPVLRVPVPVVEESPHPYPQPVEPIDSALVQRIKGLRNAANSMESDINKALDLLDL